MKVKDRKKLENLLAVGKWEEAGKILSDYLATEDDGTDVSGHTKAAMAIVYLDVMVKINEAYDASLREAIAQVKDLKTIARESKENASRRRVEANIGRMQA